MKEGIIAVSGLPGSGTTTTSLRLAERLQWRYINAGSIFRSMAAEAGVTLAEFGRRGDLLADPASRLSQLLRHARGSGVPHAYGTEQVLQ